MSDAFRRRQGRLVRARTWAAIYRHPLLLPIRVVAVVSVTIAFLVFAVVFSPIILGWAVITRYQLVRAARRFLCLGCKQPLDPASLRLADEQLSREWQELRKKHPGVKFRRIRIIDAICSHCGMRYQYLRKQRVFREVVDGEQVLHEVAVP